MSKSFAETCLQAYARHFQEYCIVIQDVFAEHMFVFAHCEQVSGISNHDCVLTKALHSMICTSRTKSHGTILVSPPRQTSDSLTGWSTDIVDPTNSRR